MAEKDDEITQLLRAASAGDEHVQTRLMEIIYNDLRRIAASQMQSERANHTLNPTALVHEAYMRLVDQRVAEWNDRRHFFAIAARIIRRILVDHARGRNAQKRGGGARQVSIEYHDPAAPEQDIDLIALDEALAELAELSERQSRVVELRYFGGLTIPDIAEALQVSERTVDREWRAARAWLYHHLTEGGSDRGTADAE